MRVPNWTDEELSYNITYELDRNSPLLETSDHQLTEYTLFVNRMAISFLNSMFELPTMQFLRFFLTDMVAAVLVNMFIAAFTAGMLAERAGWFENEVHVRPHMDEKKFPLDKFSLS